MKLQHIEFESFNSNWKLGTYSVMENDIVVANINMNVPRNRDNSNEPVEYSASTYDMTRQCRDNYIGRFPTLIAARVKAMNYLIENPQPKQTANPQYLPADVDSVTVKNTVLDSSKVVVDKAEFENIKALAKSQLFMRVRKKLVEDNKKLSAKVQELQTTNQSQKTELNSYKSVKNQLNLTATEAELSNTKKLLNKVLAFVEKLGLKRQLEKFLNQKVDKMR